MADWECMARIESKKNDGTSCTSQYNNDEVYGPPAPPNKGGSEKTDKADNERLTCPLDFDWNDPDPLHAVGCMERKAFDQAAAAHKAKETPTTSLFDATLTKPSSNAQRTQDRPLDLFYVDAGVTPDRAGVFEGAALLKGKTKGIEAEILSASTQVGAQTETQAGLLRMNVEITPNVTLAVECLTAEGHVGIHNPDGSTGINAGFSLTALSGALTYTNGGTSVTGGAVKSPLPELKGLKGGAAAHIGVRDADHNGKPEICGGVSAGPITVGGCLELPIKIIKG